MSDYDCWVYHATEAPKVVKKSEAESLYEDGWRDSPAEFVKVTDFGIDPDDDVKIQQLGDSIEGVKDACNGALNIDKMDKSELEAYAIKHFDVDIDKRKSLKKLRQEVSDMISGDSIQYHEA